MTIHWFPPSSMDIISDKLQYPVSKYFTKDKYLNCFFREIWRVKNSTQDYTSIQCLFINTKTFLTNINILICRVGEIYSLGFLFKCGTNFNQTKTISRHKGLWTSYLLGLSDVDKTKKHRKGKFRCLMFSIGGRRCAGLCHPLGGIRGGINGEVMGMMDGGSWRLWRISSRYNPGEGHHFCLLLPGGALGRRGKHGHLPLQYEIYCDNGISEYLLIEIGKGVY